MKLITAESVTIGHPDKVADYVADRILDACIKNDENSRVACEVMLTKGKAFIAGEITTKAKPDYEEIIKEAIRHTGYNPDDLQINLAVNTQSPDIAGGVFKKGKKQGAGDQGIVYGYAEDDIDYMPLAFTLARALTNRLATFRKQEDMDLRPDGKSQVTLEYDDFGRFLGVKSVLVSAQHNDGINIDDFRKKILNVIINPVFENIAYKTGNPELVIDDNVEVLINPSGRFVLGGYDADTGLTGRKLQVDTYGSIAHHGGGAFSGKDPSKVDRSGAYMARHIAKSIIMAGLAKKCEVSISYAIGVAKPTAVNIETFGTDVIDVSLIRKAVFRVFDMTPEGIINKFHLKTPIYARACEIGHFGNDEMSWEKVEQSSVMLLREVDILAEDEELTGR